MTGDEELPSGATPTPTPDVAASVSGTTAGAAPSGDTDGSARHTVPMAATPLEQVTSSAPPGQPLPPPSDGALPFVRPDAAAEPAPAGAAAPEAPAGATPPAPATDAAPDALPTGPSPWSSEEKLDTSLLPSAGLEFLPSATAPSVSAKPAAARPSLSARGVPRGLVVGLLVAAVVLVGTMIYVVNRSSDAGKGPTSVELGSDGAEVGLEPGATAVAAGTAAPAGSASTGAAAPRPYRPRRPPAPAKTSRGFIPDDL